MGIPGSGRYTTYLPVKSDKVKLLSKLFKGGLSDLYGGAEKNTEAAAAARKIALAVFDGRGDPDLFGPGVDLKFGTSPNTMEVSWKSAGDPANPYVPDITSPGPGKMEPTQKDADPGISPNDIKPAFDAKKPSANTESPAATASKVGSLSLGEELQPGKSFKV